MAESDRFLQTIEAIYAAGLEGERWRDALVSISGLFGSVATTFEIFEKHPLKLVDLRVVGLPPQAETAYLEYYSQHNPRAEYAFQHLSETTLCDYQLIDESAMDRSAYYTKYLRSLDLRYFLSGQIVNTPTVQGIVSIQRTQRQGHVAQGDVRRMRRLLPHLRRAHDMMTRLKAADMRRGAIERALDWLPDGVMLVGGDGAITYSNEAMQRIALEEDGIRVTGRAIDFPAVEARSRFDRAMAAVRKPLDDPTSAMATDFAIRRPSGAPPYLVSVRPVARANRESVSHTVAVAIIFIHDPLISDRLSGQVLRDVFGFTEAEANVARALQTGMTLADYARERAVSLNTVYTHLRRIKEKAGCNRMPELIRKLNDVRLPLKRA